MQPTRKGRFTVIPGLASSDAPSSYFQFNRALVPIGPGQFANVFDVLVELQPYNRDKYASLERTSQVTLYAMPLAVKATLARLRERVTGSSKPSFNVALSCCAANGIVAIEKDANIRELSALRTRLNSLDDVDASDFEEVLFWFDKCNVALPECTAKQSTVFVPDWLKMSVAGLAAELGISEWSLFLLAVMMTLVTQNKTLDEHREIMRKTVSKFQRRILFRREIGTKLLELLDRDKSASEDPEEQE